ncbi:MAG: hypothetical protein WCJ19_04550 [bacterium]
MNKLKNTEATTPYNIAYRTILKEYNNILRFFNEKLLRVATAGMVLMLSACGNETDEFITSTPVVNMNFTPVAIYPPTARPTLTKITKTPSPTPDIVRPTNTPTIETSPYDQYIKLTPVEESVEIYNAGGQFLETQMITNVNVSPSSPEKCLSDSEVLKEGSEVIRLNIGGKTTKGNVSHSFDNGVVKSILGPHFDADWNTDVISVIIEYTNPDGTTTSVTFNRGTDILTGGGFVSKGSQFTMFGETKFSYDENGNPIIELVYLGCTLEPGAYFKSSQYMSYLYLKPVNKYLTK